MKSVEELETDLAAVTSRLDMLDKFLKSQGVKGGEMVMATLCSHSGKFFPSDYIKMWGILYGVGLGMTVCSETLNSRYDIDPPTKKLRSMDELMHPLSVTRAPVEFQLVPAAEFEANQLIPALADPTKRKRAAILRKKQLANPKGKVAMMVALMQRNQALEVA